MNSELNYMIGIMGLSWIVVILAVAFTPYFIRKNISFGVSVPETEYANPRFKVLRRTYSVDCIVVGLILGVASSVCYIWITVETAVWIQLVSIFLYLAFSFLFYFSMRKKVRSIKQESDWPIDSKAVAELSGEKTSGKTIHTAWYLFYLVVIAVAVIAVVLKYPSLPDQIPMHYNIAGEVDRYAQKSIGIFAVMNTIPANGVKLSNIALTDPFDAAVVATPHNVEVPIPWITSLPSMFTESSTPLKDGPVYISLASAPTRAATNRIIMTI